MNWWKDTYGLRREKKVANPMDVAEMGRDLLRRDECKLLFDELYAEMKRVRGGIENSRHTEGYCEALQFGMDYLDGRLTELRDRWADSGIAG